MPKAIDGADPRTIEIALAIDIEEIAAPRIGHPRQAIRRGIVGSVCEM